MKQPKPAATFSPKRGKATGKTSRSIAEAKDSLEAKAKPAIRRGIQSVEVGFRVLAALAAESQPSTLSTIAKRAELSASQAHRYLSSLIAIGMARQGSPSGLYELGHQAIQLGLAALARTDIFLEADPAIAEFTRSTGRTTLVAALGPLGPTIVRWHAGRIPVITSLSVGSVLPLLGSATGHTFLSFMGAEEFAGAIERAKAENADAAKIDVGSIRKRILANMYASVDELLIPGLRATAVPILDIQGRAALVATVLATPAFARSDDEAIIKKLQAVCRSLTAKLGAA
jgi:DNA-binding IclR family transcriptional regulator